MRVRPHVPYFEVDGTPGEDIRTGRAVKDPEKSFDRAVLAGKNLAKVSDYLVVGESIAGGTTTALGVLMALGYDATGKISSSFPTNPHDLKNRVVEEGLKASGMSREAFKKDPMAAIEAVGDPMMAAAAGLVVGAAESIPVIMAGGTQMAAVLAIVKGMDHSVLENVAIGTTRWISKDTTSDIRYLVSKIGKVPVLAANLNFSLSRYDGLKIYETGLVEGRSGRRRLGHRGDRQERGQDHFQDAARRDREELRPAGLPALNATGALRPPPFWTGGHQLIPS